MKKTPRHITAGFLTVIYILIALMPLAPLALQSASIAHTITGECSGNCEIDGCSLESRANHTCCCQKIKLQQVTVHNSVHARSLTQVQHTSQPSVSECCRQAKTDIGAPLRQELSATMDEKENIQRIPVTEQVGKSTHQPVLKCGSPCGKNKVLALVKLTTDEILPYYYTADLTNPLESIQSPRIPKPLTSRSVEPPEPPPRQNFIS